MDAQTFDVPGVLKINPRYIGDHRGFFAEIFRQDAFEQWVPGASFVQENLAFSASVGTIRGLHFQIAPAAQGKLVRCLRGALLDVAVDIRRGSATYGRHVAVELTPDAGSWLWVPAGFAHGYCTLRADTEVLYKVTNYYSQPHERGLLWNDPALGIAWPVGPAAAVVSAKDQVQPPLSHLPDYFTSGG
jgi:dTDP-4-dehydrorhamnose 3,5-epimerase